VVGLTLVNTPKHGTGMVSDRGHDSSSIFLSDLGDMEGVYGCLKVFMGVINTVQLWERIHFILVC
jgi:hypothetical protein